EHTVGGPGSYAKYLNLYRTQNGRIEMIAGAIIPDSAGEGAKNRGAAGVTVGLTHKHHPASLAGGHAISSGDNAGSPERAFDGHLDTFWVSAERGTAVK